MQCQCCGLISSPFFVVVVVGTEHCTILRNHGNPIEKQSINYMHLSILQSMIDDSYSQYSRSSRKQEPVTNRVVTFAFFTASNSLNNA